MEPTGVHLQKNKLEGLRSRFKRQGLVKKLSIKATEHPLK